MNFNINGFKWEIKEVPEKTIKDFLQQQQDEKIISAFGLCNYKTHVIWIDEAMCAEQKLQTLAHELTHCYMWSIGVRCDEYPEEILCDMAYNLTKFIYETIEKYKIRG